MIHDDKISVKATLTSDQIESLGIGQDGTPKKLTEVAILQMDETKQEYRRAHENTKPMPFYVKDSDSLAQLASILETLQSGLSVSFVQNGANPDGVYPEYRTVSTATEPTTSITVNGVTYTPIPIYTVLIQMDTKVRKWWDGTSWVVF